jgi:hypothetical protein
VDQDRLDPSSLTKSGLTITNAGVSYSVFNATVPDAGTAVDTAHSPWLDRDARQRRCDSDFHHDVPVAFVPTAVTAGVVFAGRGASVLLS